jgi:asparagine synthase (glutamine-hydrolysing)
VCGISGWIDWRRDVRQHREVLTAMRDSLAHRGPDAEGEWIEERAALLHRRLAVVDPSGGGQPMARSHQERTAVIVYNGELYNTEDIRAELRRLGHGFESYSDTEVLLRSYLEWGAMCLPRLNGIFAFAIWEPGREELFMARDRLGVKPLFYWQDGDSLVFGSEIKAVLRHPGVPREVGPEGLGEILVMGPARTPGFGILRGLQELRPGHFLYHRRSGTSTHRYWQLPTDGLSHDLPAAAAEVRSILADAVSRQLVSDVPVCTLLSGGLDSSAITALAAQGLRAGGTHHPLTFSVDYKDQAEHFCPTRYQPDSDALWVGRVSAELGTEHHRVELDTPQLVEALFDSMKANDLPGMADVDSSLLLFCRAVRKHATVALSGEAADEIFGGYPWFRDPETLASDTFPWAMRSSRRCELLAPDVVRAIRPLEQLRNRYQEALAEVPLMEGAPEAEDEVRLRKVFYLNITRFMPTLLDRKDRMSMASGLEVRVPFCDHRLVEYAWRLRPTQMFADGREKGLLRLALRGLLPEDVIARRKSPYPKTHDPSYAAAVRERLGSVISLGDSPLAPLLDLGKVRQMIAEPEPRDEQPFFGQLMARPQMMAYLAQTDAWLRHHRIRVRI